jgi:hypothetical protein
MGAELELRSGLWADREMWLGVDAASTHCSIEVGPAGGTDAELDTGQLISLERAQAEQLRDFLNDTYPR